MTPSRLLLALLCITTVACAQSGTKSNEPEQSETANTAPQSAAQLLGEWDLNSRPPLPLPGLRMSFTVDSVSESTYFGRLTHYFAGNAGGNIGDFKPFTGSLDQTERVEFRAEESDPTALGIVVAGLLRADTIHVDTLIIGPDTLPQRDRQWFLTRR